MKKCTKCGEEKPELEFHVCRSNRDGFVAHCKCCMQEYHKTRVQKLRLNPRQPPEYKKCPACNEVKNSQQFNKSATYSDGLSGYCKSCQRDDKRLKTHGLTSEGYKKMLSHQQNECVICGSTDSKRSSHKDLCIDHDHKTGKVRGLLCHSCNTGIGFFEDNPGALRKAIEYLRKHQNAKAITVLSPSLPNVGLLEASDCTP